MIRVSLLSYFPVLLYVLAGHRTAGTAFDTILAALGKDVHLQEVLVTHSSTDLVYQSSRCGGLRVTLGRVGDGYAFRPTWEHLT